MANKYFRNQNNLICDFLIGSKTSFSISPCHIAEHYDEQIGNLKDSFETLQKLTLRIDLGSPSLVTSIRIIMTEQEAAEKKFTLLEILGNQLGENTEFQRLLRLDSLQDQGGELSAYGASLQTLQTQKIKNQMKIQAYGVTKVLQISYLINKNEFLNNSSQEQSQDGFLVMYQDQNLDNKIKLEQGSEEFKKLFDSIQIYGYSLFLSPPSNQGINLLNISNLFQKNNRKEEAVETDIILGYSLMSQRKYIQAAEIFKRCSLYFYKQYENTAQKKNNLQENFQSTPKQAFQDTQKPLTFSPNQKNDFNEDTFNQTNIFSSTNYQGCGTSNQKLLRAAKLELLVADCIRQPQLQNQKVQAYLRATEYFQGQRLNINLSQQNADPYTNILILCPYLCKFLLRTLDERIDPLRISAIKGVEFLIENLGCTISNQLPQILKQVILTYPLIPAFSIEPNKQFDEEEDYQEEDEEDNEDIIDRYEDGNFQEIEHEGNEEEDQFARSTKRPKKAKKGNGFNNFPKSLQSQASINQKVIFDMYHHLLDQFLNLLASASSQILRSIFNDVISTQLFNNEVAHDVKIYLCKITDKIISICQGDLTVTPQFITNMMNYLLNTQQQQQFTNQFKQHLERTWDNIKQKLLSNLELSQANKIVDLISDNLQNILDNQGDGGDKSSKRESQIDQDTEFNFWIEITSIVLQREKRTQENLPSNFARYYKKLEMSQENLNLKILINPYLQILELTLAHPQGIDTFKLIWSIIIDILTSASSKQQTDYTLGEVTYSILSKTKQFIANHPPPVLQLDALIIIISSLPQKEIDIGLKREMHDFLLIILGYVPHSIFEEIFFLVDCLIEKIDQLDYNLIEKILSVLIDQYTMKNKTQKKVASNFISKMMKSESQSKSISYFQWILEICLVKNIEPQKDDPSSSDLIQVKGKAQAIKARQSKKNTDTKQFEKEYDIFIDKLSFLQDCLDHLKQTHFVALISKNQDSIVSQSIIKLINSGDSKVRMKGFSITKKIHERFVELTEVQIRQIEKLLGNYLNSSFLSKQNQFAPSFQEEWYNSSKNESDKKSTQGNKNQSKISTSMNSKYDQSAILDQTILNKQQKEEVDQSKAKKRVFSFAKIMITKLIIACLKASFENLKDPKQQFNSLVLMDQFFQNLFGGPDLESELKFANQVLNPNKHQKTQKKVQIIDLETYEFTIEQYFDYDNEWYLHMRLNQILKFWPLLQNLVNSPWSNIRSLTYGVICNWVRTDLNHYKSSNLKKFLQILFRLLLSLLQSKESECRTGGLNILGSLCGLSYNFDDKVDEMKNYLHFFRRHENLISLAIWETVYDIQSDWDVTNQAAAMIIIQICAPRDSIRHFFRLKQEDINMRSNYHSYSQNNIHSHLSSKENRSTTPIIFQGKEEEQIVNDSGIMTRSAKQNNHQTSQNLFIGNNESTPSHGMFNQLVGEDDKQSNIKNNNNISSDSIGADQPQLQSQEELSEVNLDQEDSQDGNLSKNQNQDELFWFDTASEKEIRDMISMFKGEQKPPVTLWIERDTYNTEQKNEGTTTTEVITYTMNEEEDAGIYGYFDEVGINQNNPNGSSNNNNNNLSNITEEYIQQQQQQFQQMKKNNNLGLDFLQDRSKEIKLFNKQENTNSDLKIERGSEQVKDKQTPQSQNIQGSQQAQFEGKANKKFNKLDDDDDLDYEKLGIIEMEDDEPFIDDYEKKYQEYKRHKNPSQFTNNNNSYNNNNNHQKASDSNRPQTGRQVQRNSQSKQQNICDDNQQQNSTQLLKIQASIKIESAESNEKNSNQNKNSLSSSQNQTNQIKEQYVTGSDSKSKNIISDKVNNGKINQGNSEQQDSLNQEDTLKFYKQQTNQDEVSLFIESKVQEQKKSQQNDQLQPFEKKQNNKYQEHEYYEEDYSDVLEQYEEEDEEEIEEDIQEDDNEQDQQNSQYNQNQFQNLKYNAFIKIEHNNKQQNLSKKDNSRYASNYTNVTEKNSQQSSQQQNSSGKRLKDDLQPINCVESEASEAQKQILFNQRMHFREAIMSDENKESLSYTQSSQPNQKRRDTFEVTLSFSDSSIFRDEHTDKTLTKEDEPNQIQIQQQLFNNKAQEIGNINQSVVDNSQKQNINQSVSNQMQQQQQQQKSQTPQNQKGQQIQINNYFANQPLVQPQQIKQEQQTNKNTQKSNQNNLAKSQSPINHNKTIKAPISQKQDNENSNILNRTSPLPSTHQKSTDKQNLPPNNTPRINQHGKSPVNNNTSNISDSNQNKSKQGNSNQNYYNSNEVNVSGQYKKNNKNTFSPQERGDNHASLLQKQQSPYKQQVQETLEKQRLNYHHSNNTIKQAENTQLQLLNAIQNQSQHNKSSLGGSKSPSSTKNQYKQTRQSPTQNSSNQNNQLLKHLLKHPTSTKNQQLDISEDSSSKQKSKSRSKEKNQQGQQKYQAFQNNLELNIVQGQEFIVASSASSKSQGRSQKVDFFRKNNQYQTLSNSHSPYQTMNIQAGGGSSSTKHQKSTSKSRSKSNGKKRNGQKTTSFTPSGFFKNRTPSHSPPTSTGKNNILSQLRLQGSNSGGKSRSLEKNASSNLSSTFNNTISSVINGINNNSSANPSKPPLKTNSANTVAGNCFQNTVSNTNKNNLNLHSIDKLYKTDFLSRLLDSTKSNVSSIKATNITPKSCKTKISSSRNSKSKENNSSTIQCANNQSYYSNQNNPNSITINSQSYNNMSNSNFSFAGNHQKESYSPQQSNQFDDEVHQQFSYDDNAYSNIGAGDSKNCTLDLADAFQNIDNQHMIPLKQQSLNNTYNISNQNSFDQSQQKYLIAQIAQKNNQITNKLQVLPFKQNIQVNANQQIRSSRRGSEGNCLPVQVQGPLDIQQNSFLQRQQPLQQNFIIQHQQQQVILQNQYYPQKSLENKENHFDNSADELLEVLTKQRNQRSTSAKSKKRSTSGGKNQSQQSQANSKNTKGSSNSAKRVKVVSISQQGNEKLNKFEPYKQPLSPNRKKKFSPNQRPQSSIYQHNVQQANQQQLSVSSVLNSNHFSSTSQDSSYLQSQYLNQTAASQTSHNNSFQSYNKPPLVKKQQQNNSRKKEINFSNSRLFIGGNLQQQNNQAISNNNTFYVQEGNQIAQKKKKKIQFNQNHSFDDSLINTTL
ncbi:hypothetical protein ABPG72_004351 [Tetrahymena utriculariae]